MADAPKADSGSGWGAFEIGIAVLIIVVLLSKVENGTVSTTGETGGNASLEQSQYSCGLQVTSPVKNQIVGSVFTLRGITEGCLWEKKDGKVLSYQVIDEKGVPLSTFTTIFSDSIAVQYVFEETVTLTTLPQTKQGSLILVAPSPGADNQTTSVRIPIRFEK